MGSKTTEPLLPFTHPGPGVTRPVWSPTDLNHFLDCEHLLTLERSGERGDAARDAHAELLAAKGLEHERAWLHQFAAGGRRVVTIDGSAGAARDWVADAERTRAAMAAAADVIYQGVLVSAPDEQGASWRGISDFLVRVDTPSPRLGAWSYEAWDTKLARRSRPHHLLQLCFYSDRLAELQGRDPAAMHVVLGTSQKDTFRYCEFDAYYRAIRRRFTDAMAAAAPTYPYPVHHCSLCVHARACQDLWERDDHLSLVAHIRRDQVERLNQAGVRTVAQLGAAPVDLRLGIGAPVLDRLRSQAALQARHRLTGRHEYELLPAAHSGFRMMPAVSDGDIFFDMEGDPYFEPARGLEYLFGLVVAAGRRPEFRMFRAFTREEEKHAFESFVDFVHERLARWPDLHVYHYAPYEIAALKRLMSEHATREDALDDLLRREVFVDLYQVVRQSVRISHASYSIKKVRTFFMEDAGRGAVADGGDSILQFERWRETGNPAILDAIVRYNEEDCVSTLRLRDWLVARKGELEAREGVAIPWKAVRGPDERTPERIEEDEATRARREQLVQLADAGAAAGACAEARLLADLLDYHRREAKPEYWAYFERRRKSLDELMDDTEAIAGLERVDGVAADVVKSSRIYTLRFPPQEFKLGPHAKNAVEDPLHGIRVGTLAWVDARAGRLGLKRAIRRDDEPLPQAISAGPPIDTRTQRAALRRIADDLIASASAGAEPRYRAILDVLRRAAPAIAGVAPGAAIQTTSIDRLQALVASLDRSYVFVQGPPGSGKTFTAARLIVSLVAAGKRIAVAANTHKAINNLLLEVERVAAGEGVSLSGLKKGEGADALGGRFIQDTDSNEACETADVNVIAGTGWLFSRPAMDGRFDYLFVDEAGQIALADALAMATAANNLVLIGDPQQLPHVRQGVHPGRSGCSVLEHLLGSGATVADDRGIFLAESWRMHPNVCAFVSDLSYGGRLASAAGRERQRIDSGGLIGAGLRFLPVEHTGNAQQSAQEARVIAAEVGRLLDGGRFTDCEGNARPLTPADILVVAPYNMQVRCLAGVLPAGVEAGTVDRFQGRQAPIVFFSMTSSTGQDVPRGLEFLFSRNRFNVAISRARAMAVVVCSPHLLNVACRTVEQMQLVNAVCRFVECATQS